MTIKVNAHSQMGITRDVAGELFSAKRRKRRGKSSSTESYIKQTPKALARGLVSALVFPPLLVMWLLVN